MSNLAYIKKHLSPKSGGRGLINRKIFSYNKQLPKNYISRTDAEQNGWKAGKWPSNFVSGKMIGGSIYKNKDGHLPDKNGRKWYEADINYRNGKRNKQRVVWSNDGLVFVTYDHYETFYEIV